MTSIKGPLTESSNAARNANSKTQQEVPIFLRKTFHMINTCDSTTAAWGEDGLTFVVKNPETFEKNIIPQFFKHSKFTSFVRQLNFYGFRKIKFTDSIRINAALEEKTANFWRFRHDNFRRGREDLLVEIKRSNSNRPSNSTSDGRAKAKSKSTVEQKVGETSEGVAELKCELSTLKSRIAQMTNNIDELTSLVKTVALEDGSKKGAVTHVDAAAAADPIDNSANVGTKRKKLHGPMDIVPDQVMSSVSGPEPIINSSMEDMNMTFTPSNIFPMEPVLAQQGQSVVSDSDEAFVDELFNFGDDMDISPDLILSDPLSRSPSLSPTLATLISTPVQATAILETRKSKPNAPDEKMMNELSDALTLLPKDIQGLLVNRLITTITSSDALKSHIDSVRAEKKEIKEKPKQVVPNPDVALPLAAATLTALMTQFSVAMKDKKNTVINKSLPVIPIHA